MAVDGGLVVARETLRRWPRAAGRPAMRKRSAYRQRRKPKTHFGELVQMDGSSHKWLEDCGPEGCLMHLVDDATSTALFAFSKEETTWAATNLLRAWIERYGVPKALYTDRKNVHVRAATEAERLRGIEPVSQSGRMCARLGIRIVAANSPRAKGRVERAQGTHQDRLVKKLRLAGVADYEAANRFLEELYLADHNRRFARTASSEAGFHRKRPAKRELDAIFHLEQERGEPGLGHQLRGLPAATGAAEPAPRSRQKPRAGARKSGPRACHRVSQPQPRVPANRPASGLPARAMFCVRTKGRTQNTSPKPSLKSGLQADAHPTGELLNHQPEEDISNGL